MRSCMLVFCATCALMTLRSVDGDPQILDAVSDRDQRLGRPIRSVQNHPHRHHHRSHRHELPMVNFGHAQSDQRTRPENAETQRLKQLVLHSQDKVVDFERGKHMDANDEAVRQSTWSGPADNETLQLYVQRNCTACLMREEAKLNRIERIKEDLLQRLGVKVMPNITDNEPPPSVPNLQGILTKWGFSPGNTMTADQAMVADQPFDGLVETPPGNGDAKTERVYAFATKAPMFFGLPEDIEDDVAYFRFSTETMNNDIDHADLHVHINNPTTLPPGVSVLHLKMNIYTVDNLEGKITLIHSKQFKRNYRTPMAHWEKADVSKQVRHWFRKPEKNYGFLVRVMHEGENLANIPTSYSIQGDNQIYLDIITRDGARRRPKRSAVKMDCTERDNDTRCCRYPLVLDFESFGWDWVIAPKKYLAYYCSGECPFQHLQRYAHTHLVQQANPRGSVGPCCYPTQMAPILMVYFNHNKEVLISTVPGMVVTRCGCA